MEDCCGATGLELITVEEPFRGRFPGAPVREDDRNRPFGIFDGERPSREDLVAMGLRVRDDHDADTLRSYDH